MRDQDKFDLDENLGFSESSYEKKRRTELLVKKKEASPRLEDLDSSASIN